MGDSSRPDEVVAEVQGGDGGQALEGQVGEVVGVEGVGHLEVEQRLADLTERVNFYPGYLVAGQVEPRHAGDVVEGVAADHLD